MPLVVAMSCATSAGCAGFRQINSTADDIEVMSDAHVLQCSRTTKRASAWVVGRAR
jgi:hypothetical protein